FVVVSTLEAAPVREAQFFLDLLNERKLHVGAIVLNKVLPEYLLRADGAAAAKEIAANPDEVIAQLAGAWDHEGHGPRVLAEIGTSFNNYRLVAQREAELRAELSRHADSVAALDYMSEDITDLRGLLRLGAMMWRN
ncbi:MAG TPA: hypothetical protein PLP95_11370, partial [Microthrixaceae bacterium]|nr:hypothetical protein [Microthrixaceae bacterium]